MNSIFITKYTNLDNLKINNGFCSKNNFLSLKKNQILLINQIQIFFLQILIILIIQKVEI